MEERSEALRIELLGGFRVTCGGQEIPDDGWRLAKARSLVKIVALAPGQSILREQLVDLLWPELDPGAGANNLHQALHIARRTLGTLLPGTKPNRILRLQRGILSLEPPGAPIWIDVDQFERRARGLLSERDPANFYDVLDLYRGDLLPDDLYEDWAADRRTALHEQHLSLLDRLASLHRDNREATPAIDALRRIVAIEPDREEAHRSLMELYALTGRRQQALRQYERLTEALERELGFEPEPETDDLYQAILSGEFPDETWEPAEAVELQPAPRPEITETIAEFLSRVGDFVGRSEELSTLQGALGRVICNRGEIILIAGEAGIGKTRISEEFLRYAGAQGVRTLWGRCYEGDGAPAYWPWVQVVRSYLDGRSTAELRTVMGPGAADIARIVPELRERLPGLEEPPPLDPDGERFRLFDSMTTFLKTAAERAPLALIIDDLHSADRSSLLLLEFLSREIAETGLLIIGTYRHVEVDRGHPLTSTLGQLARHEANARITLEGLSVADINRYIELVTGRAPPDGLASAIQEQTEGNPFFVREIVALLIEEERLNRPEDVRSWRLTIPHGIRETIALRTSRLSDTAHQVLTTASVSGRDFELPIVAQVADLDELDTLDALEEALGTGLIIESPPTPGGFRFTHAITRETLYDNLSRARRLRMHLRTGEAIEAVHAPGLEEFYSAIAHHYLTAAEVGGADKAVAYLLQAGRQARERAASAEAAIYFTDAARLIARHTVRIPSDEFARVAIGYSQAAYQTMEDISQANQMLESAFKCLDARDNALRVEVLFHLTRNLATIVTGESDAACKIAQFSKRCIELAHEEDASRPLYFALSAKQYALGALADPKERLENSRRIVSRAAQTDNAVDVLGGYSLLIQDLLETGDIQEAIVAIDESHSQARMLRDPYHQWAARMKMSLIYTIKGDLDMALQSIEENESYYSRYSPVHASMVALAQRLIVHWEQNSLSQLQGDLKYAIQNIWPAYRWWMPLVYLERGQYNEANNELDSLIETVDELPAYWYLANLAVAAEAAAALGSGDHCKVLYDLLAPHNGRNIVGGGAVVCLGATSHYLGRLATVLGDTVLATSHFSSSIALHRRMEASRLLQRSEACLREAEKQTSLQSKGMR